MRGGMLYSKCGLFLSLFIKLLFIAVSSMLSAIFCHLEIKKAIWQIWHNLVEMPFQKSGAKMTKHWLKSPEARDVEGICPFKKCILPSKSNLSITWQELLLKQFENKFQEGYRVYNKHPCHFLFDETCYNHLKLSKSTCVTSWWYDPKNGRKIWLFV